MLSRLRPRFDRTIKEFVRALEGHPALSPSGHVQVLVPLSAVAQKSALRELKALLKQFPGMPALWAGASRLAEATGNDKLTWKAIDRARRLAPENSNFHALSLQIAVQKLRSTEADEYLSQAYGDLHGAEAEVCLMYAFGEISLAERSPANRNERRKRALTAVDAAFPRSRWEWLTKTLIGVRLYLEAALAKRKADPNLLYRAGLGRLAAISRDQPLEALHANATARIWAMAGSDFAR